MVDELCHNVEGVGVEVSGVVEVCEQPVVVGVAVG
jgi:hypothetical protein